MTVARYLDAEVELLEWLTMAEPQPASVTAAQRCVDECEEALERQRSRWIERAEQRYEAARPAMEARMREWYEEKARLREEVVRQERLETARVRSRAKLAAVLGDGAGEAVINRHGAEGPGRGGNHSG